MKQLLTLDKVNQPRKNRKAAGNTAKTGKAMAPKKKKKKHTRRLHFFMLFKTPFSWNFAGRFFTKVLKTKKNSYKERTKRKTYDENPYQQTLNTKHVSEQARLKKLTSDDCPG